MNRSHVRPNFDPSLLLGWDDWVGQSAVKRGSQHLSVYLVHVFLESNDMEIPVAPFRKLFVVDDDVAIVLFDPVMPCCGSLYSPDEANIPYPDLTLEALGQDPGGTWHR